MAECWQARRAAGKRAGRACLAFALLLMVAGAAVARNPRPLPRSSLPPPVETVARVLWLGKQRLAADTNAASLMGIWNLAESRKLEAQTLDRLAWAAGAGVGHGQPVIGDQ